MSKKILNINSLYDFVVKESPTKELEFRQSYKDVGGNYGNREIIDIDTSENDLNVISIILEKYKNKLKREFGVIVNVLDGEKYKQINVGDFKVRFHYIIQSSEKISTQMQEKGAVWVFNQVLRNSNPNVKFSSIEDIKKYSKYGELKKIFGGEVPKDWLESYLKQQEKMIEIFQSPDWDEFKYSGSGSFMQYIRQVSSGLGYRYETWNPSDIWLVKNQSQVEKEINENIGKDGRTKGQTIYELNDLLRKLIKEKRVVGVSLKKVSGKKAKFEYVNIDSRIFDDKILKRVKKQYNVPRSNIKIKLDLSLNNEGTSFSTEDLTVKVGNRSKFQIKDNDGRFINFGNLKFEYSPTSSSARGGKAPIEKVEELLKAKHLNFKNNYKDFITSWTGEEDLKNKLKPYRMKIDQIQKNVNIGSISTDKAIENFEVMFKNGNEENGDKKKIYLANSKLMQLEFIWQVLQITRSNNFEEFWTDMIWISTKRGKDFAPHGKLY